MENCIILQCKLPKLRNTDTQEHINPFFHNVEKLAKHTLAIFRCSQYFVVY